MNINMLKAIGFAIAGVIFSSASHKYLKEEEIEKRVEERLAKERKEAEKEEV